MKSIFFESDEHRGEWWLTCKQHGQRSRLGACKSFGAAQQIAEFLNDKISELLSEAPLPLVKILPMIHQLAREPDQVSREKTAQVIQEIILRRSEP